MRRLLPLLLFVPVIALAQSAADLPYQMPPREIAEVVDAPPPPNGILSPDGGTLLLIQMPPMLTIADLSQPELKLAGTRFNPETHDQTRSLYATSLTLVSVGKNESKAISGVPAGARMRFATWSPDAGKVAFALSTPAGVELWVADRATGAARRVSSLYLNHTMPGPAFEWMPDSRSLVARVVPPGRAPFTEAPHTPTGPAAQESSGRKAAAPTFEDMLRDENDAAAFQYHMQAALVRIPLDGEPVQIAPAAMIIRGTPSPDGRFFLVETMHRPFSYRVPAEHFPLRTEILSADGTVVRLIADLPLAEQIPLDFDAARTGPRQTEWRADKPAVVFWAEALDEGNPRKDVPFHDRLLTLAAPFTGEATNLMDLPLRYYDVAWGNDSLALVNSRRWKDRKVQTWRVYPNGTAKPALLFDRSSEDRYNDPGRPLTEPNASGKEALRLGRDGHSLYLIGEGASTEGTRPFIDRMDVDAKKATRLYRSSAPYYDMPLDVLDERGNVLLIRRESVTEPPNWFVRDNGRSTTRSITSVANPTPQVTKVQKEVIRYKRADGVDLHGTLYLPPGYDPRKDGALPVVMWAYPAEFKSAAAASQINTSPYRYTRMTGTGSPIVFTLRGYAVLDNPTIPIIGEGTREPNDTYVEQLVAGAQAAVDELVRRGVGDRDRMAIAGHSYGAFMTANLLAHSDLFRAGIARSGAYNRTLTPFSFQAEQRTYWEAPETYTKMSPFTYADKINEPILLIHGMEDDNTGTFPIQSERLYQAISGLGGTVRLVMLPKEAHGYRARESVMHVLWEMDRWLDKYVKNAGKR